MAKPQIDWNGSESHFFINPLLPEETKKLLSQSIEPYGHLKGHIWLASSGTENFPKMIALSKKAMMISAESVNAHLKATNEHAWLNILPLFHAGGLSIHARAMLSGSSLYDFSEEKWNPTAYMNLLEKYNIAFSSLTPTHVYDLIALNFSPPHALKAIIIGGGMFPKKLHEKAYALGWPLLKSYGMTEVCSQVATASQTDPEANLQVLKHIEMRFNPENFIEIKSAALLTGFIHGNDPKKEFIDPKVEGWYTTQDKGALKDGFLQIHGRGANYIKIGGESINVSQLESLWENIKVQHKCPNDAVLIDLPDERLGNIICLAAASDSLTDLDIPIEEYNCQVLPIAKIRKTFHLKSLPRTELFKLKKNELRQMIMFTMDGK
jgi:O-succinylbenzoic acid--CoA ligase